MPERQRHFQPRIDPLGIGPRKSPQSLLAATYRKSDGIRNRSLEFGVARIPCAGFLAAVTATGDPDMIAAPTPAGASRMMRSTLSSRFHRPIMEKSL